MKPGWIASISALCAVVAITGCASDHRQGDDGVAAHGNKGADYAEKGQFDEAIKEFNEVIRLDARDPRGYFNRGAAYLGKDDPSKAISDFSEASRLNPRDAEALNYRGIARAQLKQFKEADADFKQAITLDPNYSSAHGHHSLLLSSCPANEIRNGAEAVKAATKACELTNWKNSMWLDALATAFAESADFDQAVRYEQAALKAGASSAEAHNRMVLNLTLFQSRLPFRNPTMFR